MAGTDRRSSSDLDGGPVEVDGWEAKGEYAEPVLAPAHLGVGDEAAQSRRQGADACRRLVDVLDAQLQSCGPCQLAPGDGGGRRGVLTGSAGHGLGESFVAWGSGGIRASR